MSCCGCSCITSGSFRILALWRKVWALLFLRLDGTPTAKTCCVPFPVPLKFFRSLLFLCLLWDIEMCQSLVSWWYKHRLFLMLRRFPIESKGRRKKLREVCLVYLSSFLFLILPHGNDWCYCFFAVLYSWYNHTVDILYKAIWNIL